MKDGGIFFGEDSWDFGYEVYMHIWVSLCWLLLSSHKWRFSCFVPVFSRLRDMYRVYLKDMKHTHPFVLPLLLV